MPQRRAADGSGSDTGFEQRLLRRLRRLGPEPGSLVVVGFSGGADSLALARGLSRIAPVAAIRLLLLHVDHRLRPESGEEAARAAALAAVLSVPFMAATVEPGAVERHAGVGIEEGAAGRYLALAAAAEAAGTDLIALAHHQTDQAEAVLLHLMRGAGIAGASGMDALTTITIPWWEGATAVTPRSVRIWRPLLEEPRGLVRAYASRSGLSPVEDPTNQTGAFRRNRVRREILPALERIQPGATAALARFAGIAAEEDALLDDLARIAERGAVDAGGRLAIGPLRGEPLAIQRRIIRRWLHGERPVDISRERIDAVLALLRGDARPVGEIEVGEGRIVIRDRDYLLVGAPDEVLAALAQTFPGPVDGVGDRLPDSGIRLSIGTPQRFGGWLFGIERLPPCDHAPPAVDLVMPLPARALVGEATLRRVEPGDRWARTGRTLGDWLRRAGVPALIRPRLLVVATAQGAWAVLGVPSPRERDTGEPIVARVWVRREGESGVRG